MNCEEVKPYAATGEKTEQVRAMFDSIAPSYDLMNRLMTMGIDRRWRRAAVGLIADGTKARNILDVATGTADVAIALAKAMPSARIAGIDLSPQMIAVGCEKVNREGLSDRIALQQADCLALPYDDNTFDAVTVAYGVRNFSHLADGYREMLRVLRPGGRLVVVELSEPSSAIVRPFYRLYSGAVIPLAGRLISHDSRAYSYLPQSIRAVPQRHEMTRLMESCGFDDAQWRSFTFGVCTLYTAIKPQH